MPHLPGNLIGTSPKVPVDGEALDDQQSTPMSTPTTVIIGGGFSGLSAAFELAKAGRKVIVLERDQELGGLGGSFELRPGVRIEKFYHHWFTSDRAILALIDELGLTSKVRHLQSRTGLYYANTQFRLASPLDLLRFTPLPFVDRIRTGIMALVARKISNWRPLEDVSAADWMRRIGGKRGFEVIWKPLLNGKFGPEAENVSAVWIWNKLKLRGSSRGEKGKEELLYFEKGFQAVTDALSRSLVAQGVEIRVGAQVSRVVTENGVVRGVMVDGAMFPAEQVLSTVPLPVFLEQTPELPAEFRNEASKVRFLGNVCLVLRMKRSLSDTYWLNVADPSFPFVGIIEHTNFDSPSNFGGEHIAYLSKYLPTSDALYKMTDEEVFSYSLPFIQRMFPKFSPEWLHGYAVWRAPYSQPVVTKRYSSIIPPFKTPIKGLWLCTMAQVYPEDRGTNYAVEYGRKVGRMMLENVGESA